MIIDKLSNSHLYIHNDAMQSAFEYLQSLTGFPKEEGKLEINDLVFANIDRYQTKPVTECRMEAHRDYIDIQILFSGREIIAWHPVTDLSKDTPYDPEKDVAFFKFPDEAAGTAVLQHGIFMLLYPEDGHMPQIAIDSPEPVEKIVMKVKV